MPTQEQTPANRWRAGVDGMAVGLALLRDSAPLVPPSGHMLLFTYAILTIPGRGLRLVMSLLLVETTIIKLAVWGNWRSWALGGVTGLEIGENDSL